MIFTDRKITIRNGKSTINEPVILYRGDYEVSIRFTIMESKFRFKSGVNLVDSEKASFGQLAILAPYGGNVFSEVVKCEDGTVTFTLTKEMIDQLEEVGLYSFQIRLFDYYRESRVSIPPVEFGIEVREPVASEDHDNEVNNAIVGYSIAKVVEGLNEDVGPTFDADGQYNKTDWNTGDRITEGKLNKIEDAIDKINQNEKNDIAAMDKKVNSNYNVLSNEINTKADVSYVNSKVNAVASGSPKGVYATVAALTSAIPKGDSNIYVVSADGCWYYWKGSAWTKGGVYQDTKIGDNSVEYAHLSPTIQSNDSMMMQHVIIPAINDTWINVDTNALTITISETGSFTSAYKYSSLNTVTHTSAPADTTVLSYDGFASSCVLLLFDVTTRVYSLLPYNQDVPANTIVVASFRLNNSNISAGHVSSDMPYKILINGKPDPKFQNVLDKGILNSKFLSNTLFINKGYNRCRVIFWNVETKTVTIYPTEFMYGITPIYVSTKTEISYDVTATLLALGYDLVEKVFKVMSYSQIVNNGNFVLYDFVRAGQGYVGAIFTDNIIFTDNGVNLEYMSLEDMHDRHKYQAVRVHSNQVEEIDLEDNDDVIIYDDIIEASNNYENASRFTFKTSSKNAAISDCFKIDKASKIRHCKFTWNPEYCLAFTRGGFKDGKFTGRITVDSQWISAGSFMYDVYNERNNQRLSDSKDSTIILTIRGRKTDGSIITEEDIKRINAELNLQVEVSYYGDEITDFSDFPYTIDWLNTPSHAIKAVASPRIQVKHPITLSLNQVFQCSIPSVAEYNGIEYDVRISLHGFNADGVAIYDSDYVIVPGFNEFNLLQSFPREYNKKRLIDVYNKIDHYLVYVAFEPITSGATALSQAQVRELANSCGIKYNIRELTLSEYRKIITPDVAAMLIDSVNNGSNATATMSTSFLSSPVTYTSMDDSMSIVIPDAAKGFIVEFRAKVEGDIGYIQFANDVYKMSVVNRGMKSFKMRFNKSDISQINGDITITPPSEGSITIQNLKITPVYDEVPTSNHNNAQFYMHRGYSSVYPENTLLAVEEACKHGATIVEIDTFSSSDNKTLICHDSTLGRTNVDFPNRTYSDATKFSMYSTSAIRVDSDLISKFAVHEYLTITDNGTARYAYITNINTSTNVITISINTLTGPVTKIQSQGVSVPRCSLEEFLQYEVGAYKNSVFKGELNAPLEDYIKVVRRYNAALLLDIRSMNETNFKGEIAGLLDKYDYWDKCYFMHGISNCNTYHKWAQDIDRKIVIAPILWTSGDELTNNIQTFGTTEHSNASRKDVVFQSSAVTEENVALAHSLGMRVHVFTVNNIAEAQRVLRMGVDIIGGDYFSDDTAILW